MSTVCNRIFLIASTIAALAFVPPSGATSRYTVEEDLGPCKGGEDLLKGTHFGPKTPLKQCIRFGNTQEALKLVAEQGKAAASNQIVLWYTALTGNTEVMKALLAHGADPNQAVLFGNNMLGAAAANGHAQLVKVLLDAGVDPNRHSNKEFAGGTALVQAAGGGHLEVVKLLVVRGANVDLGETYHGYTPLWAAVCESGDYGTARFLLEHGANPNVRGAIGFGAQRTPLACALKSNNLPMTELLIQHNADMNTKSLMTETPLSLARQRGNTDVVPILGEAGAPLSAVAAEQRSVEAVMEVRTETSTEEPRARRFNTEIKEFAFDGFEPGAQLFDHDLNHVRARLGEPKEIKVYEGRAYWDIDIQEIPKEWRYDGFSIWSKNTRDAIVVGGKWMPGPRKVGTRVTGIVVTSPKYKLRYGLHIGSTKEEVIRLFGYPAEYYRHRPGYKKFPYNGVPNQRQFEMNVIVEFDEKDTIKSIEWKITPWH